MNSEVPILGFEMLVSAPDGCFYKTSFQKAVITKFTRMYKYCKSEYIMRYMLNLLGVP